MLKKNDDLAMLEKLSDLVVRLPDYAQTYIKSLSTDYQIRTRIAYAGDLIVFFDYLRDVNPALHSVNIKDIPVEVLISLTPQDIIEYKDYLQLSKDDKGKPILADYDSSRKNSSKPKHCSSSSTINRRMAPLRALYHSLIEFGYTTDANDPTKFKTGNNAHKVEKKEIVYLEKDEVRTVTYAVKNSHLSSAHQAAYVKNTAKRDYALYMLLLTTGIRVSECAGINLEDLNLDDKDENGGSVVIYRKGGKEQTVYFPGDTLIAIKDYIENERKNYEPANEDTALFLSIRRKRMTVRSIENVIKKYAVDSLPNGHKITPHKLRSTYGTALYDETADIRLVADVLGHEDISTTAKHYAAAKEKHRKHAGRIDLYK